MCGSVEESCPLRKVCNSESLGVFGGWDKGTSSLFVCVFVFKYVYPLMVLAFPMARLSVFLYVSVCVVSS